MTDSQVRTPIKLDLRVAMGDPVGVRKAYLPDDGDLRVRLAKRQVTLADYWYLRGFRKYLERDFASAVEALNISLLHEPGRAEAHFTKGVCLQLAALDEGMQITEAPERMPARAHSLLMKARWAFSIALELNPEDEEARTYLQGIEALLR